jgi:hypothetical protein
MAKTCSATFTQQGRLLVGHNPWKLSRTAKINRPMVFTDVAHVIFTLFARIANKLGGVGWLQPLQVRRHTSWPSKAHSFVKRE